MRCWAARRYSFGRGAALVLARETPDILPHDAPPRRLYLAMTEKSGEGNGCHFEDDGMSWAFRDRNVQPWSIHYTVTMMLLIFTGGVQMTVQA